MVPLKIPTPKPPPPPKVLGEDFTGLEHLDRPELDDLVDTERNPLPNLEWDSDDNESGVKRRAQSA